MSYRIEYLPSVVKTLNKLDRFTKRIIVEWIEKNLQDCDDPRIHGKPLATNRAGQWRYKVGDYRIIAKIEDNRLIILVLSIGHRRDIYK